MNLGFTHEKLNHSDLIIGKITEIVITNLWPKV